MSAPYFFIYPEGEREYLAKEQAHSPAWCEAKLASTTGAPVNLVRLDDGGAETTIARFVDGVPVALEAEAAQ